MKHNSILDKVREQMNKDKWYIKLKRKINLNIWLIYCLLFNNKCIQKLKIRVYQEFDLFLDLLFARSPNNEKYLDEVKSMLSCNDLCHKGYTYTNQQIEENKEYFFNCKKRGLSPYKALELFTIK